MKHKVWKIFTDFEKEERWLNEMAAKGLNLVHYAFARYYFTEGTPGEYIYRIELLENMPDQRESKAYIQFMEETGAEYVANYTRWVYFRKKRAEGSFDLYSDYDSRINHYSRIASLLGVVTGLNLLIGIMNLYLGLSTGQERGIYVNAYVSIFSLFIVLVLAPATFSYLRKIQRMKTEKQIFE